MGPEADFFTRNRLPSDTKTLCWDFVQANLKYPEAAIRETPLQGHCSYTLYLGGDTIIQFRPRKHQIDLETTTLARRVFGDLAPSTQLLGAALIPGDQPPILAYQISRISGTPLSLLSHEAVHRESLVLEFAHLVHAAWVSAFPPASSDLEPLKRRNGRCLRPRLTKLSTSLPPRFRPMYGFHSLAVCPRIRLKTDQATPLTQQFTSPSAAKVLAFLPQIESLPWVLTHGDLIPSNISV